MAGDNDGYWLTLYTSDIVKHHPHAHNQTNPALPYIKHIVRPKARRKPSIIGTKQRYFAPASLNYEGLISENNSELV